MGAMFDALFQLPLFQDLCHEDLISILGKVKLHFIKYKVGETIIESGSPCKQLCFLLKGEVSIITSSKESIYTIIEQMEVPYPLEPQSLFGINTHYTPAYVAHMEAHTVSISKTFVLSDLFKYEIFRLNYMDITSSQAQNLYPRLWEEPTQNLRKKIIRSFLLHCEKAQEEKIFKVKMDDLARHLDSTRLNVSKAFNELQDKGLLELRREEILIPNAQKLVSEQIRTEQSKKIIHRENSLNGDFY